MNATLIALQFMMSRQRIVNWRQNFYNYIGTHFERIERGTLLLEIHDFVRQCDETLGPADANKVVQAIEQLTFFKSEENPPFWLDQDKEDRLILAVKNGPLDLTGIGKGQKCILLPSNDQFFSTGCVPYDYDPAAKCPKFEDFIRWFCSADEEMVRLLQDFSGGLLLPIPLAKALWLHGCGANGKSVFISVLANILGVENVSSLSLEQLSQRFALANAIHRLLIFVQDADTDLRLSEGKFKSLVSQDQFRVEEKFKDAMVVRPRAKIIIACNQAPRFRDRSDGIWRRLILVPCNARIDEKEARPKLAEELVEDEGAGILNWLIAGAARLHARGHFEVPDACKTALDEERVLCNSPIHFIREQLVAEKGSNVKREEVLEAYQLWCKEMGYRPVGWPVFLQELKHEFGPIVSTARPGKRGEVRPNLVTGITWELNEVTKELKLRIAKAKQEELLRK